MSRLQSDIAVLENMLSSGLLSILGSLIALVGIVIIMLVVNVGLALLAFTVLPVMVIIAAFWQRYAQRSFRRTRAAISLVNSTLQENISGMRVIQGLAREGRNSEEFDDLNRYNRDTNVESGRIAALILPLVEVVAAVATALVIIYGGILVMHGQLKTGDLVVVEDEMRHRHEQEAQRPPGIEQAAGRGVSQDRRRVAQVGLDRGDAARPLPPPPATPDCSERPRGRWPWQRLLRRTPQPSIGL